MRDAFEAYVARSLTEEMDRVDRLLWRARRRLLGSQLQGRRKSSACSALNPQRLTAMELRRMYVDPSARRSGIARLMLQFRRS
jgi:putative acetyltransferase